MAWSYVTSSSATANGGNLTFSAEPTGAAQGDLLIAFIGYRSNAAFTLPAGWSLVATQQSSGDIDATSGIASGVMAYIIRGASAPDLTFTRTGGDIAQGFIFLFTGNDGTDAYDTGGAVTEGSITASHTLTGISAAGAGELLLVGYSGGDNTGDTTSWAAATDPTTGWSEIADSSTNTGADNTTAAAWATKANTGATGDITCSSVGSSRAVLIAGLFIPAAGSNTDLVVADAAHGNTTDAAGTLTQAYSLALADGTHAHAADAPTLAIPLYYLARATPFGWVQETLNTLNHAGMGGWLQESVEEPQGVPTELTVADAAHAHAAEAPTLALDNLLLVVADAAHAHAAEAPTLVLDNLLLVVADAAHAHAAETFDVTSVTGVAPADAAHAHAADAPTLALDNLLLTVSDAHHAQAADNIMLELEGQTNLVVADSHHAHATDGIDLTAFANLVVNDSAHAHAADAFDLTSASSLTVGEALHAQGADNVVLSTAADTPLAVADALHAHLADNATIQLDQLQMQYGFHALTSDELALVAAGVLARGGGNRPSRGGDLRPSAGGRERPGNQSMRRRS